jgi:predicted metal-dependent hydrolase
MKNILLLGLLLGSAACSRSPSHEELVESLQSIQSWTATAQMVGETWQQGNIPDAYAEQTLKKSQEEIAREKKDLTEPSVQQPIQQIQQTLQQLITAVKHHQKGAIAAPLQQLSTQHQQLDVTLKAQERQL